MGQRWAAAGRVGATAGARSSLVGLRDLLACRECLLRGVPLAWLLAAEDRRRVGRRALLAHACNGRERFRGSARGRVGDSACPPCRLGLGMDAPEVRDTMALPLHASRG